MVLLVLTASDCQRSACTPIQGEAIAFALGGNARMMRARNLGALVNHAVKPAGTADSDVGAAGQSAAAAARAEVVLHFDILRQRQSEAAEVCDKDSSDTAGAASCSAALEGGGGAGAEEVTGRLLVRRRVSRAGRCDLAVMQLPPQGEPLATTDACSTDGESDGKAGSGTVSPAGSWQTIMPAALRDMLAPFGVQTEAVDRWGPRGC